MEGHILKLGQKAKKVIYFRSQGIIVTRQKSYFTLSVSTEEYPNRRDIKKLLEPLRKMRNGYGVANLIEAVFQVSNPTVSKLRQVAPGFSIKEE